MTINLPTKRISVTAEKKIYKSFHLQYGGENQLV